VPPMDSAELIRAIGAALFGSRYQHDLAEGLGVNRRTVSRWSGGADEPRPGVWLICSGPCGSDAESLAHCSEWSNNLATVDDPIGAAVRLPAKLRIC
jgi:hypothetical protein